VKIQMLSLTTALLLVAMFIPSSPFHRNIANLRIISDVMNQKKSEPPSVASPYLQGVYYFKQGRYPKAITLLQQVIPRNILVRWYLAQALSKTGDWNASLLIFDPSLASERKLYADVLFEFLPTLSMDKQDQWQQKMVFEYPDLIIPYASHLLAKNEYGQAQAWAKLTPNYAKSVEAQSIVGQTYFYTSQYMEAEKVFRAAYEQFPGHSTLYWYGRTLLFEGKADLAIPLLQHAVQLANGDIISAWYLGDLSTAYGQLGNCTDANAALDHALELDRRPTQVQRIESLRDSLLTACR